MASRAQGMPPVLKKMSPLPEVSGIERQHSFALDLRFCFLVGYERRHSGEAADGIGVIVDGAAVVNAGRRRMDVVDVQDRQIPGE